MTTTALAVAGSASGALAVSGSVQINGIPEVFRLAESLAGATGFVPAAYLGKPHAIAAAILTGLEINMGPMEALREIHIVQGRPTLSAGAMLARAIRSGVRVEWLEASDKAARLKLTRGSVSYEQSWTIEDAKRAQLLGKSGPWQTYPGAMLRARAISAAVRAFCPDVIGGGGLYTPDEAEHIEAPRAPSRVEVVSTDGEIVDTQAEPAPRARSLGEIADEADLHEWCSSNASKVSRLSGARRVSAERSIAEAAARCGVSSEVALAWAGMAAAPVAEAE